MKPTPCSCSEAIKRDTLSLGKWVACPKCGRDHGLVRPTGFLSCVVIAAMAYGCGLFAAGRLDAPAVVPDGPLFRYAAMALTALLGMTSFLHGVRLITTFSGIPEERETAISRTLTEFDCGLTALTDSDDPLQTAQDKFSHCRDFIETIDEFAALPTLGHWSKAQAAAVAGAAAHRSENSADALGRWEILARITTIGVLSSFCFRQRKVKAYAVALRSGLSD